MLLPVTEREWFDSEGMGRMEAACLPHPSLCAGTALWGAALGVKEENSPLLAQDKGIHKGLHKA